MKREATRLVSSRNTTRPHNSDEFDFKKSFIGVTSTPEEEKT
jgi:hypothetical protein